MADTRETVEQILARLVDELALHRDNGADLVPLLRASGLVVVETLEKQRPPLKEALRQLAATQQGSPWERVPRWLIENEWGTIISSLCAEALARIEELEAKAAVSPPFAELASTFPSGCKAVVKTGDGDWYFYPGDDVGDFLNKLADAVNKKPIADPEQALDKARGVDE